MLDVRLAGLLNYVKSLVFSEYFNKITVPSALNRLEPSTDFWRNLDMKKDAVLERDGWVGPLEYLLGTLDSQLTHVATKKGKVTSNAVGVRGNQEPLDYWMAAGMLLVMFDN
ncbi:hypothetical protein OUZ56_009256 [Daphnia magna]|uniref:Uncharacterized protein n=1 Tax=Daphnia magna TaxID=35525 RepID=A0ABR0AFI3_9CRUS|nr:hypothetical protein OUZ56_009256 [Daphnia magna]